MTMNHTWVMKLLVLGVLVLSGGIFTSSGVRAEDPTPEATPVVDETSPPPLPRTGSPVGEPKPFANATSEVFTVFLSDQSLGAPVGFAEGQSLADDLKSLTVYANGVACTTVALTDLDSEGEFGRPVEIGLSTQPVECAKEGARIQFVDGKNRELAAEFTFKRGYAITLNNLAPEAPHTGGLGGHLEAPAGSSPALSAIAERAAIGTIVGAVLGLVFFAGMKTRPSSQHKPSR